MQSLYDKPRDAVWEAHAHHLDGGRAGLFCVVSYQAPDEAARQALLASAKARGYRTEGATSEVSFVSIVAGEEADGEALELVQLATVIESLDPLCLVIADLPACEMVAQAYRARLLLDAPSTLLGRPVRAFSDLGALLASEEGKRRAWNLMKTLPER